VIRAVTFDAAGTLVATREPVGRTYARFARAVGIQADEPAVERGFRAAFRAAPPLAFGTVDAAEHARRERAWWRDVVRAALGEPDSHPRLDECFDALFAYYARPEAWAVHPDVRPVLDRLRGRGLATAVISNFDGRLPGLLDGLGLGAAFDAVVWSSAVGAAKPAPAIFAAALDRLGVPPAAACHVGDDREADVAGAADAGLHAVHLDREGRHPDAIRSLVELPDRLAALETTSR
jgi:putative hydrolase of the HAD superfamily